MLKTRRSTILHETFDYKCLRRHILICKVFIKFKCKSFISVNRFCVWNLWVHFKLNFKCPFHVQVRSCMKYYYVLQFKRTNKALNATILDVCSIDSSCLRAICDKFIKVKIVWWTNVWEEYGQLINYNVERW